MVLVNKHLWYFLYTGVVFFFPLNILVYSPYVHGDIFTPHSIHQVYILLDNGNTRDLV